MSLIHTSTIPALLSALLLAACVVVDPGDDDGAGDSSSGSSDGSAEEDTAEPPTTSAGSQTTSSSEGSSGSATEGDGSEGGSTTGGDGSESGSDTGATDEVCEAIVGTTFSSVEEHECGLGPMGPVPCHWQITFEADGEYLWMYSDVGEGGNYTCEGGVITTGVEHDIAYDVATGILTWDGVEYVAVPA